MRLGDLNLGWDRILQKINKNINVFKLFLICITLFFAMISIIIINNYANYLEDGLLNLALYLAGSWGYLEAHGALTGWLALCYLITFNLIMQSFDNYNYIKIFSGFIITILVVIIVNLIIRKIHYTSKFSQII